MIERRLTYMGYPVSSHLKEGCDMQKFKNLEEVLEFAIGNEIEARDFYWDLSKRTASDRMSEVFSDFAAEEDGHRLRLEHVKAGKGGLGMVREVPDLSIGDFIVDEDPYPEMDYASALVLAMKKEKKAFKLYLELADLYEEGDMRQLFLSLAQEEAKHKLRFEIEYDDNFLAEM